MHRNSISLKIFSRNFWKKSESIWNISPVSFKFYCTNWSTFLRWQMHKPCLYLERAASLTERSSCIAMCAECLSIHNIRDSNPSEVDEEVASDRRLVWSFPWWSLISTIIYYLYWLENSPSIEGIRRGLVVTMLGLQVRMSSQIRVSAGSYACWPGRYINVRRCGGLTMVRLQLQDH